MTLHALSSSILLSQPKRRSAMKNEGASNDREAPLTSDFVFSEVSPTLWKGNDEEEEVEEAARVIWKASQPQDPVLNRLMEDALTLGNPARIVQTKSWSPSPNSCTTATSSSTHSVSGRTSKSFRTGKRRTFATNLHQEEAVPAQKDDFDESIQRLVALLPAVSKKADENAKREQEELRLKRRSEKKAARLLAEGRSGTKKRRSPIDCKGKQPTIDDLQEEEISTAVEDSPTNGDMHSDRSSAGHEVTRRSLTSRNMPPPLFVPLRKSWSGDDTFSSSLDQRLSRSAHGTTETERGSEELSFNSSSFIATSTPHPPSAAVSSNLTRDPFAESRPGKVANKSNPPSHVCVSSTPKLTTVETNSQASSHSSSTRRDYDSHYDPASLPSQSGLHALSSQVPTSKVPHPSNPCGPPVLGMRRLPHSQNFSLNPDRPLPVKRDRFRVPFAKPKHENRNQAEVLAAASNQSMSRPAPPTNSLGGNAQKISADPRLGRGARRPDSVHMPQAQSSQKPSSNALPTHNRSGGLEVNKISTDPVSPPQADPDSSMDYDMGIDPEELERVCSAYD